ncbi:hypothetical protein SDC9_164996 [bioreactor metagenome]|uniref:Uncharacterized protein n=1 Tax=bioreactor metagenome TaxID=1076179 RepID=A0A645FT64_9ZZZZ
MNIKDFQTARFSGQGNLDLPVKTAGANEGLVQNFRTVGGCHNDYTGISLEAVHFSQELVQRIFLFTIAA